jgi:hypothetical protein
MTVMARPGPSGEVLGCCGLDGGASVLSSFILSGRRLYFEKRGSEVTWSVGASFVLERDFGKGVFSAFARSLSLEGDDRDRCFVDNVPVSVFRDWVLRCDREGGLVCCGMYKDG